MAAAMSFNSAARAASASSPALSARAGPLAVFRAADLAAVFPAAALAGVFLEVGIEWFLVGYVGGPRFEFMDELDDVSGDRVSSAATPSHCRECDGRLLRMSAANLSKEPTMNMLEMPEAQRAELQARSALAIDGRGQELLLGMNAEE